MHYMNNLCTPVLASPRSYYHLRLSSTCIITRLRPRLQLAFERRAIHIHTSTSSSSQYSLRTDCGIKGSRTLSALVFYFFILPEISLYSTWETGGLWHWKRGTGSDGVIPTGGATTAQEPGTKQEEYSQGSAGSGSDHQAETGQDSNETGFKDRRERGRLIAEDPHWCKHWWEVIQDERQAWVRLERLEWGRNKFGSELQATICHHYHLCWLWCL